MVLLEASGGLELPLVAALAAEAVPVVVVNPRQVRDLSKATGKLAKTDSLDAAVIAHFAEVIRPPVRPLRDAETQALNSLVARRHQVMTMLVSEKNHLSSATVAVRPRIEAHIAWLEGELDDLDEGLRQTPRQSLPFGERRTTSCAPSPEWESRSPSPSWPICRSWACWTAGRSPPSWEWLPSTGTAARCGANAPYGGDAPGSALPCTWEPCRQPLQSRHLGLLPAAAGKPKKLALTACMRKLLGILNSMLKRGSPWRDLTTEVAAHSS